VPPLYRITALAAVLMLAPQAWGEQPNPDLLRARQLIEDVRFTEASRALEAALARASNDRATLLEILELQGVVAATLQSPAKARAAFQALLVLSPEYELQGDYAPRVMTPFFEAKAWVSDFGALQVEAAPASRTQDSVERVAVRLVADPLKMGRAVRFRGEDGAGWFEHESPLVEGEASTEVKGERVRWWAELLDERQAVLATVGSEATPVTEVALRLEGLVAAPPSVNEPLQEAPPWRALSYASLGAAVGAGAAGGYFGLRSRSARSELEKAAVDERGLTTGLTQREAYALEERARSSARLANALFGVAGAVAIAGGTFWVLGTRVQVAATPTGVTVGGELP
jgi:hypothetical protein